MPSVLSFCPLRPWASNASIATFKGSRSTENKKNAIGTPNALMATYYIQRPETSN